MMPTVLAPALQSAISGFAAPGVVAIAIVYFLIVAAIATWATRLTRSASDFFVAGAGVGLWTLAIAKMAATLSGFAFIGGPGLVYTIGIGAVFIILPGALSNALGAWVLAKKMRLLGEARGLFTVPDAIGARYRSPVAQGLSAAAVLIAVVGYIATNLLALGLVIDAIFGTGLPLGIWIGTAVILAYSVAGGILAGIYTDVFQGSVMALASLIVFVFALKSGGGMSSISHTIMAADAEFLGPWGRIGPIAAISFFFVFGVGSLGQPHVVHKFYMLRDPRQLKWYPLLMTVALAVTQLLYVSVGIAMRSLVSSGALPALGTADQATPTFLLHYTPTLVAGLVFSGVAAAIMATVNSFMSVGAAALTHDIPVALGRRVGDELRWGRVSTVALAVAAAGVAQASGTLVAFLGIFGWGLFASTIVPSLAIGLNWAGATKAGAIASIVTGLVVTLVGETLGYFKVFSIPTGVSVSALALVSSLLAFFVVSWLTPDPAPIDADIQLVMDA
ncbi:MAG: putative sodium/proline symporter [Gemmatimonadetes bacterium]|jgi:Na+/proline symporter|nr:putative sodium/proline symporter [Gemmatimonadota bacterium]